MLVSFFPFFSNFMFFFLKERLHKVQDCSPQKKNNPQYDGKETESRESMGIFLYLMDSYE